MPAPWSRAGDYLDWSVADPDGAPIGVVRTIRDDIDARITDLLAALPGA